jgi:hypothetical protein
MGLWDVKDPTMSRQSAHRCGNVVSPTHRPRFISQKNYFLFLILISVRCWVNPTSYWKKKVFSTGFEPTTFRLVACVYVSFYSRIMLNLWIYSVDRTQDAFVAQEDGVLVCHYLFIWKEQQSELRVGLWFLGNLRVITQVLKSLYRVRRQGTLNNEQERIWKETVQITSGSPMWKTS